MAPGKKQKNDLAKYERQRELAQERQRRRRAAFTPEQLEHKRAKDRERLARLKIENKIKSVDQLTPREQRNIRKVWRESKRKRRGEIKTISSTDINSVIKHEVIDGEAESKQHGDKTVSSSGINSIIKAEVINGEAEFVHVDKASSLDMTTIKEEINEESSDSESSLDKVVPQDVNTACIKEEIEFVDVGTGDSDCGQQIDKLVFLDESCEQHKSGSEQYDVDGEASNPSIQLIIKEELDHKIC